MIKSRDYELAAADAAQDCNASQPNTETDIADSLPGSQSHVHRQADINTAEICTERPKSLIGQFTTIQQQLSVSV